ncbi:hypothetical protein TNCV_2974171 [Trichonephila clavipes]|nr:hypothetical protein TNCV_2974171 [Trichonephila clavipes]
MKLLGLLYPKNTSKVSLNQCRGVWQRGSPEMAATLATDSGRNYTSQNVRFHILHESHSVFGYPKNLASERCLVPINSDKRRSTV